MNRYYFIPIPSRYLPRKIPNRIPNWRVSVSLSMQLCTLRIGIHFLKDPGFRALVGLRDPFDDLCCVEGISIWSDRLRKARGSNGTGESIQKRQFYFYSISIRLVLVSDLGSVSPFFRDELLAPVLHFVSVDRGERELSGKRIVTWEKQGGQPLSNIQHGFWQCNVVGLSCRSEWIILSTEVNLCPLNWNGKIDVTPVTPEMVRSLAQEEGIDPYHLDLVLISLFFKNTKSGSSPTRIE